MLSSSFPLRRSKSSSAVSITTRPSLQIQRDRLSPNSQRHAQAAATLAFRRAQSRDQLRQPSTSASQASSVQQSSRTAATVSSTPRPLRSRANSAATLASATLRTPLTGRSCGQSLTSVPRPPMSARSMSSNTVAAVQPKDSLDLLPPPAVPGRGQSMQNMALNVLHESVPSVDTLPQYSPGLRRHASQRSVRTAGRHQVLETMPELGTSSTSIQSPDSNIPTLRTSRSFRQTLRSTDSGARQQSQPLIHHKSSQQLRSRASSKANQNSTLSEAVETDNDTLSVNQVRKSRSMYAWQNAQDLQPQSHTVGHSSRTKENASYSSRSHRDRGRQSPAPGDSSLRGRNIIASPLTERPRNHDNTLHADSSLSSRKVRHRASFMFTPFRGKKDSTPGPKSSIASAPSTRASSVQQRVTGVMSSHNYATPALQAQHTGSRKVSGSSSKASTGFKDKIKKYFRKTSATLSDESNTGHNYHGGDLPIQHVEASKRHFGPSHSMRHIIQTPGGRNEHLHESHLQSYHFDHRDEESMVDISLADPFAPSRSGTPAAFANQHLGHDSHGIRSMSPSHTINTTTSKSRVTSWADSTVAGTVTSSGGLGVITETRSSPSNLDAVLVQQMLDEHSIQQTNKHTPSNSYAKRAGSLGTGFLKRFIRRHGPNASSHDEQIGPSVTHGNSILRATYSTSGTSNTHDHSAGGVQAYAMEQPAWETLPSQSRRSSKLGNWRHRATVRSVTPECQTVPEEASMVSDRAHIFRPNSRASTHIASTPYAASVRSGDLTADNDFSSLRRAHGKLIKRKPLPTSSPLTTAPPPSEEQRASRAARADSRWKGPLEDGHAREGLFFPRSPAGVSPMRRQRGGTFNSSVEGSVAGDSRAQSPVPNSTAKRMGVILPNGEVPPRLVTGGMAGLDFTEMIREPESPDRNKFGAISPSLYSRATDNTDTVGTGTDGEDNTVIPRVVPINESQLQPNIGMATILRPSHHNYAISPTKKTASNETESARPYLSPSVDWKTWLSHGNTELSLLGQEVAAGLAAGPMDKEKSLLDTSGFSTEVATSTPPRASGTRHRRENTAIEEEVDEADHRMSDSNGNAITANAEQQRVSSGSANVDLSSFRQSASKPDHAEIQPSEMDVTPHSLSLALQSISRANSPHPSTPSPGAPRPIYTNARRDSRVMNDRFPMIDTGGPSGKSSPASSAGDTSKQAKKDRKGKKKHRSSGLNPASEGETSLADASLLSDGSALSGSTSGLSSAGTERSGASQGSVVGKKAMRLSRLKHKLEEESEEQQMLLESAEDEESQTYKPNDLRTHGQAEHGLASTSKNVTKHSAIPVRQSIQSSPNFSSRATMPSRAASTLALAPYTTSSSVTNKESNHPLPALPSGPTMSSTRLGKQPVNVSLQGLQQQRGHAPSFLHSVATLTTQASFHTARQSPWQGSNKSIGSSQENTPTKEQGRVQPTLQERKGPDVAQYQQLFADGTKPHVQAQPPVQVGLHVTRSHDPLRASPLRQTLSSARGESITNTASSLADSITALPLPRPSISDDETAPLPLAAEPVSALAQTHGQVGTSTFSLASSDMTLMELLRGPYRDALLGGNVITDVYDPDASDILDQSILTENTAIVDNLPSASGLRTSLPASERDNKLITVTPSFARPIDMRRKENTTPIRYTQPPGPPRTATPTPSPPAWRARTNNAIAGHGNNNVNFPTTPLRITPTRAKYGIQGERRSIVSATGSASPSPAGRSVGPATTATGIATTTGSTTGAGGLGLRKSASLTPLTSGQRMAERWLNERRGAGGQESPANSARRGMDSSGIGAFL